MSDTASAPIDSPCVLICQIHQDSGHCHGCGRTIDEIMQWANLTAPIRGAIMDELPARMAQLPKGERRVTRRQRLRQKGA